MEPDFNTTNYFFQESIDDMKCNCTMKQEERNLTCDFEDFGKKDHDVIDYGHGNLSLSCKNDEPKFKACDSQTPNGNVSLQDTCDVECFSCEREKELNKNRTKIYDDLQHIIEKYVFFAEEPEVFERELTEGEKYIMRNYKAAIPTLMQNVRNLSNVAPISLLQQFPKYR